MTTLTYAGIGSRRTPPSVLREMGIMAAWLARTGRHLASGGALAGQRTLYLPWPGYNGHRGPDCVVPGRSEFAACIDLAARLHPAWNRRSPGASLHGRSSAILLGPTLDRPVDTIVAWTPRAAITGGTGLGLRIAAEHGIPVLNLAAVTPREVCERLLALRRAA